MFIGVSRRQSPQRCSDGDCRGGFNHGIKHPAHECPDSGFGGKKGGGNWGSIVVVTIDGQLLLGSQLCLYGQKMQQWKCSTATKCAEGVLMKAPFSVLHGMV